MQIRPNPSYKYSFWEHGVSQSMMGKFLQCPKQCYLEYVEGWTSVYDSDAIFFGNLIHHCLEELYRMPFPNEETILEVIKQFEILNEDVDGDVQTEEKKQEFYAKAEAILLEYVNHWKNDWSHEWKFTEEIFKQEWEFNPDERPTFLNGKIDGCLKIANKGYWLMDHKVISRISLGELMITLSGDLQLFTYMAAMCKKYNFNFKGFYYNIIRRPGQKVTKLDTNLKKHRDRIREDIKKRPEHYFTRLKVPMSCGEVANWVGTELNPILDAINNWAKSNYEEPNYYNPMALTNKYGMAPMTKVILNSDYNDLYQRDQLFSELVV